MRSLGPGCTEEITPQRRHRGLEKRFCSDRCCKAFSRVVAGGFSASVAFATAKAEAKTEDNL
jgi:hypothetical protein